MNLKSTDKNDFSKGSVIQNILTLAAPMILAQVVHLLYNIVDRIYIGMMPENATPAMTGIGLTLPIISIIIAFTNLFGVGGAPLSSIARGKGDNKEAEAIMGNSFILLLISGILLTISGLVFKNPLLHLFGASSTTFSYANDYITIYLLGSIFVIIGLGMNSFINAQGFGKTGMLTVVIGAVINIILDPIFIFGLDMGVKGAALATTISQFTSSLWIIIFLCGKKSILRLKVSNFRLVRSRVNNIASLGFAGFVMAITNSAVQIICNTSLQYYGGDLYIGIMTVINSIREVITLPVSGFTNAAQPVISFNYGARLYDRVRTSIKFMSVVCVIYTLIAWGILNVFPELFIKIFSKNPELIDKGLPALRIYFFGFFMMPLQFAGQATFVALGKSRQAIFFSLLRKVIIVIPLTLLLPKLFGLGINGVFLAEPISNFIGGIACYVTMLATVRPELKQTVPGTK